MGLGLPIQRSVQGNSFLREKRYHHGFEPAFHVHAVSDLLLHTTQRASPPAFSNMVNDAAANNT